MNKNLLIGVGVGLIAYYLLFKHGKKKCTCNDQLPADIDLIKCTDIADERMRTTKRTFKDDVQRQNYRQHLIDECLITYPEKK